MLRKLKWLVMGAGVAAAAAAAITQASPTQGDGRDAREIRSEAGGALKQVASNAGAMQGEDAHAIKTANKSKARKTKSRAKPAAHTQRRSRSTNRQAT